MLLCFVTNIYTDKKCIVSAYTKIYDWELNDQESIDRKSSDLDPLQFISKIQHYS